MIANVGSARIRGAEAGLQARPVHDTDLLFGLTATYLQDVITDAPALTPASPTINHVGDSFSDFYQKSNEHYVKQGDYGLVNLRFNFNKGPYRLGAYLDNACNKVGIITASIDTRTPTEEFSTMPRTVGITAGYSF